MSDAMTDAFNENRLVDYYTVIKALVGMRKNWLALQVAKAAEQDVIAKFKGTPRRWQREIRAIIDNNKAICQSSLLQKDLTSSKSQIGQP